MVSYLKFAIILNAVDNFSKEFRKAAKSATTLGAKFKAVGDGIKGMAAEMAALAFVGIVDFIGQAAEAAATMDRLARQAAAFSGGVSASIEELTQIYGEFRGIMLDANRLQMFTPEQIGEVLKFLALAGATPKEIDRMVDTVGHLAYATGTELADAGRITLNIMRAFGKTIEETTAIADGLTVAVTSSMQSLTDLGQTMKYAAPSMSAAGRSMEEAMAAAGLLANAGLKATQAGTALRQTVAQLLKPTDESLKLQSRYNLALVEFTPAAESAKAALTRMAKETERFKDIIDRTEMDVKSLQYAMEGLAIGTTENQLQIMAIRLKASREGRNLTQDELDRMKKLELANDMLAYESTQVQLETMRMGHAASGASIQIDKLTQSEKAMAETARTGIKGIRPLEDILRELEKVGDDTAVIFELFGIRSATAVLALRDAMYEGEAGADAFAKFHGQIADAMKTSLSEAEALYLFMATGAGAALDILTSKQQTYYAELGYELLPLYIKFREAMVGFHQWLSEHGESIGKVADFLGVLASALGGVLKILTKYPELLGVLIGAWLAFKLVIPIRELMKFVEVMRFNIAVMRSQDFELVRTERRFNNLALAAAGVAAAVGGAITAYRMFTAEGNKAKDQAMIMTAVQWGLSAAFFAVMVAQMGISSLGVLVPVGVALAASAALALRAIAGYQAGGMISGSAYGTPALVGENYTSEAIIPLKHGAVPVDITGGDGGLGGRPVQIGKIEVNVVDADQVVEAVTEAVYDGVRRGITSGA